MNSAALKRAKRQVRRTVLEERDALSPRVRAEWGEQIVRRVVDMPEVRDARAVMLFSSFGSEVPTGPLIDRLRERAIVVALPRIEERELVPVAYTPGDPVRTTSFGALEPIGRDGLDPASLDVVGVPGVAFDRLGGRVGYGGGYYDRFLRGLPAFRIGIAFGLQVLEDPLPAGRFDLPVQAIVTEEETIRPDLNSRSIS
ncbi:MAG: 5-formyltetrahydrofolate cyclo-ligase [Actinomycetia bacterium]|jgi:5-formyltetrahydrofolate cyclo-ligase|nr:5-formyltetrahydrofolate cyclo-ligase [Actinomycetes bacterium]